MKKVLFTAIVALFAVAATAKNYVVKPNDWKVGDSRNYEQVLEGDGVTTKSAMSIKVSSVTKDQILIDCKSVSDTASEDYLGIKMVFGDSLASAMNNFVCKVSLSKNGEFGHFENYEELKGLFGGGLFENLMTSIIGTTQKDAEDKMLAEIKDVFWYMNKKFDSKGDNLFKKDFTEKIFTFENMEVKVKAGALDGKITFVQTANISKEQYIKGVEKGMRAIFEAWAQSMGVSQNEAKSGVEKTMEELKKNMPESVTIKETVVFEEESGWLSSYNKVTEWKFNEGVTKLSSTTITAK